MRIMEVDMAVRMEGIKNSLNFRSMMLLFLINSIGFFTPFSDPYHYAWSKNPSSFNAIKELRRYFPSVIGHLNPRR